MDTVTRPASPEEPKPADTSEQEHRHALEARTKHRSLNPGGWWQRLAGPIG